MPINSLFARPQTPIGVTPMRKGYDFFGYCNAALSYARSSAQGSTAALASNAKNTIETTGNIAAAIISATIQSTQLDIVKPLVGTSCLNESVENIYETCMPLVGKAILSAQETDLSVYCNAAVGVITAGVTNNPVLAMFVLSASVLALEVISETIHPRKVSEKEETQPVAEETKKVVVTSRKKAKAKPSAPEQQTRLRRCAHINKHPNLMDRKTRRIKQKFPINQPANRR